MSRERRGLFVVEESQAEPGRYGCPMLVRGSDPNPVDRNQPFWRCSLGWAIHGEHDAACCQATELVSDCWKVHPERTPVVAFPAVVTKATAD